MSPNRTLGATLLTCRTQGKGDPRKYLDYLRPSMVQLWQVPELQGASTGILRSS